MTNMSVSLEYYAEKLKDLQQHREVTFDKFHHGDSFNQIAENFFNCAKALKIGTVTMQKGGIQTTVSML